MIEITLRMSNEAARDLGPELRALLRGPMADKLTRAASDGATRTYVVLKTLQEKTRIEVERQDRAIEKARLARGHTGPTVRTARGR